MDRGMVTHKWGKSRDGAHSHTMRSIDLSRYLEALTDVQYVVKVHLASISTDFADL
jgi:hypothetical protein